MAFDTPTRNSQYKALGLLDAIRTIYRECKTVQEMLQLYQSGNDVVFNNTINAIHSSVERQHLAQMLNQINTMISDWEINHTSAIGL